MIETQKRLQGKIALITGGASGMGVTHVKRFLREGAYVVFTDIDQQAGVDLAGELGDNVMFLKHDVTDFEEWSSVVHATAQRFGSPNVLVNNAGVSGPAITTLELEERDYRKTIEVDQHGIFFGMRAVIPGMIRAGGGSIVNISSVAGIVATSGFPNIAYVAAKFAVRGMSKAAAIEYGRHNVRVNSLHPGAVLTPMTDILLQQSDPSLREAVEHNIPLGRFATCEEVSDAVMFLASDESTYVTGAEFVVDGGLTAQ